KTRLCCKCAKSSASAPRTWDPNSNAWCLISGTRPAGDCGTFAHLGLGSFGAAEPSPIAAQWTQWANTLMAASKAPAKNAMTHTKNNTSLTMVSSPGALPAHNHLGIAMGYGRPAARPWNRIGGMQTGCHEVLCGNPDL